MQRIAFPLDRFGFHEYTAPQWKGSELMFFFARLRGLKTLEGIENDDRC
jgi:hypothetical protein